MPGLIDHLPLWTPRLCLRLFTKADGEALFEIQRDPLLTRYAGGTRSREQSANSLDRIIDRTREGGFGPLAVEENETGQVVGWCGVQKLNETERFEIIYAFRVSCWGLGYATEAATALVRQAIELDDPQIPEVWGLVYPQNVRSIRVLEKLGMNFVENELDEKTERFASLYSVTSDSFLRNVPQIATLPRKNRRRRL